MRLLHDVFISYPSILDKTPYPGWIEKFESQLFYALKSLIKNGSDPGIYLDRSDVRTNSLHEEMLARARSSRLFLAIVSPDYQERVWAPRELEVFATGLQDKDRLFVVATTPLPEEEIKLPALKCRPIKPFFSEAGIGRRAPMPFHPDSREFSDGIYAIARDMAAKLSLMHEAERLGENGRDADKHGAIAGKTILVTRVTDDLQKDARSIIEDLELSGQAEGIVVLYGGEYSLGGDAFREAFEADVARADLVVQLLNGTPSATPRDLPEGYAAYQANRALAQPGVKLMQWRRSDLDVNTVEDEGARQLLLGENVIASTLPAFKDILVEWVRRPPPPPKTQRAALGVQIFINAEQIDLDAAIECRNALRDVCASIWLPPEGDEESQSKQKELLGLVKDCQPLLFLSGRVDTNWIARQLRWTFSRRLAEGMKMDGAVCVGPPPEKSELHGQVDGIETINCRTPDGMGWQFDTLREYLRKRAGASL